MRFPKLFDGERIGALLVACALVNLGCGGTPTEPSPGSAVSPQSALNTAATPVQPAVVAEAAAAHLNPTALTERGWSCRPSPFADEIGCSHPGQGFPSPGTPPEDRPANFTYLMFDGAGNYIGTLILLRADLYHGQICESTGGQYSFRPPIGYYECFHSAGK
jgi:hypothetical protein